MERKRKKAKKKATNGNMKRRLKTIQFCQNDDEDILDDVNVIIKKKKVKSALPLMREIFGEALKKYRAKLEAAENQKQAG